MSIHAYFVGVAEDWAYEPAFVAAIHKKNGNVVLNPHCWDVSPNLQIEDFLVYVLGLPLIKTEVFVIELREHNWVVNPLVEDIEFLVHLDVQLFFYFWVFYEETFVNVGLEQVALFFIERGRNLKA